jgi:hypothetical protein
MINLKCLIVSQSKPTRRFKKNKKNKKIENELDLIEEESQN